MKILTRSLLVLLIFCGAAGIGLKEKEADACGCAVSDKGTAEVVEQGEAEQAEE